MPRSNPYRIDKEADAYYHHMFVAAQESLKAHDIKEESLALHRKGSAPYRKRVQEYQKLYTLAVSNAKRIHNVKE